MRVLAIESSGRTASIALVDAAGVAPRPLAQRITSDGQRTAQSLVPAIKAALDDAAWQPADVGLVCVTTGPGSFTGLRIGVVAAKTFAYAVGAKLVGVHTLAALAAGVDQPPRRLWTVLDAQRQELFAACFDGSRPIAAQAAPLTEIASIPALSAQLQPGDAIAGPPLIKLLGELPSGVKILDEKYWAPQASRVALLGLELFNAGTHSGPLELLPHYYRKSAAEEKAELRRQ